MGHATTKQINRFNILKTLGKGAQGTVYLAEDTHLQRQVAIKTMQIGGAASGREQRVRALLDEAMIAGKLQHPNIVTLYDAGEEDGSPYLVFEYVEGEPLTKLIEEKGRFDPPQAVEIAIQILDAIAFAHHKQVVHRDIKPSNVIVMDNGTARVMDFGIAQHFSAADTGSEALSGTPAYMAPEYINSKVFQPSADVFAAGMVLYEMLAGAPAVSGKNLLATINQILNLEFAPPSRHNDEVDEKLDHIVLKALAKNPEQRYASADAMSAALRKYLNPEIELPDSADAKQATLDFLLRRMRHKSDFPALSHTMSMVNKVTANDREKVAELSNNILCDFALTNKLLRLVNSATYSQFSSGVSTISRAVMILGFEAVRNIAVTLMLYEHLQNKSQAAHLKEEASAAYFNGVLAREMARSVGLRDAEEAFICAMFHPLGKLLVTFYFHEEMLEINRLMQQKGMNEATASSAVLGISYEELGIGVARSWNLPGKIVNSMRRLDPPNPIHSSSQEGKLRVVAELSNELCEMVRSTPTQEKAQKLDELVKRFSEAVPASSSQLTKLVEKSAGQMLGQAAILNLDLGHSSILGKARGWAGKDAVASKAAAQESAPPDFMDTLALQTMDSLSAETLTGYAANNPSVNSQLVLTAGVQDITNSMAGEFRLNDILRIILETMYRGMGFTRVLLCINDTRSNAMKSRFGFGQDIDTIVERFSIPLSDQKSVFHAAISKAADIFIADINAESIRPHIPDWYRKLVPAQSFILFPIIVNKKAIGIFYGDKDVAGTLNIRPDELNMLKILRNQAVLAIKQKH